MLPTNNPIIKPKAGLLNLAQELQNVSKACKVMGVSRDTFYRYQELVAEGGVEALTVNASVAMNLLQSLWFSCNLNPKCIKLLPSK
jgi:ACT domain-containing protein